MTRVSENAEFKGHGPRGSEEASEGLAGGSGTWERQVGKVQLWKSSAHGKETDDRIKISP